MQQMHEKNQKGGIGQQMRVWVQLWESPIMQSYQAVEQSKIYKFIQDFLSIYLYISFNYNEYLQLMNIIYIYINA